MPPPDDRFRWHPAARIANAPDLQPADASPGSGAVSENDAPSAVAAAFAIAAQGLPFRIGGGSEPPKPAPLPMFETLTSGTSGTPRRIWRSQASWTASFAVNAGLFGIGPGVSVAVPGRLVHSLALYGAVEALHLGATLHLLADLRPDRQRAAMAQAAVAVLYATPAQIHLLVQGHGPLLPALRVILIGGSKLEPTLRHQIATLAPNAALHEFYGAAETSFLTMTAPDDPAASVGRPYPGVRIDLRGPQGETVAPGKVGEVWAQSPYLFSGYGGDPGSADWRGGWLSVGEMGRITDGVLYLSGRKSRVVQIADQSVYPEQIEAFMATLPGIGRIAVLPEPDAKRGAILLAIAQGDPAQETAILAATRHQFGALKCPRRILWRSDWPLLQSGKTDLAALQSPPCSGR